METYLGHNTFVEHVFMHESGGSFITQSQDRVIAWAKGSSSRVMEVQLPGLLHLHANRNLSQLAAYIEREYDDCFDVQVWK